MTIMVRLIFARKRIARNMFVSIVKMRVSIVIKVTVIFISARYVMVIIERRRCFMSSGNNKTFGGTRVVWQFNSTCHVYMCYIHTTCMVMVNGNRVNPHTCGELQVQVSTPALVFYKSMHYLVPSYTRVIKMYYLLGAVVNTPRSRYSMYCKRAHTLKP